MECPKCRSTELMIRQNTGLERLRVALTGLRQYRCSECDTGFRAPDRRKKPRPEKAEPQRAYNRSGTMVL